MGVEHAAQFLTHLLLTSWFSTCITGDIILRKIYLGSETETNRKRLKLVYPTSFSGVTHPKDFSVGGEYYEEKQGLPTSMRPSRHSIFVKRGMLTPQK